MKKLPPEHAVRLDALERLYLELMGQYINMLRNRLRKSQEEVALAAGLSRTEIHNIEHGLTNEKIGTMHRVCRAVQVSYGEVVTHTDYLMDHPEARPPPGALETRRGKKRKVHSTDGDPAGRL